MEPGTFFNRAPQPRVAGWEKRWRLPSGPEVVLQRNASLLPETPTERARRSPWKLTGAERKPALSRERSGTARGGASPAPEKRTGTGYRDTALLCALRTQLDGVPGLVTMVTGVAVCRQREDVRVSPTFGLSSEGLSHHHHDGVLKGSSYPHFPVLEYAR